MKKYLLSLSFVLVCWVLQGQVLTVDPAITVGTGPISSTDISAHAWVTNESDDTLHLMWDRNIVSFHQGWESWICDKNLCYTSGVSSCPPSYPNILAPGESMDFQVHVNPWQSAGTAEIHVPLYEMSDPATVLATVVAQFEAGASSVDDLNVDAIRIFPNPTSAYFEIRNGGNVEQVVLYGLVGNKVRAFNTGLSSRFDVSDLPQGVYLVRMLDAGQRVVKTVRLSKR